MVPDVDIGGSSGVCDGVVVVLVSLRVEAARIRVTLGVRGDSVGVVDDSRAFGDQVTLIVVVLGNGVGLLRGCQHCRCLGTPKYITTAPSVAAGSHRRTSFMVDRM